MRAMPILAFLIFAMSLPPRCVPSAEMPDTVTLPGLADAARIAEESDSSSPLAREAFERAMLEEDAEKRLSSLLEIVSTYPASPWATEACYQIGFFAFLTSDYDRSLEAYQAYLLRRPNASQRIDAQLRIAECLRVLGRYPEALQKYLILLQMPQEDAGLAKIKEAIAACMMATGQYGDAIGILQSALSEFPAYAQAQSMMLNFALCLEEIGQLPQARKTYADLKLQYPKTVEAELAGMRLDDLNRPLLGARADSNPGASAFAPAPFKVENPLPSRTERLPAGNTPAAAFPVREILPKSGSPGGALDPAAAFPATGWRTVPGAPAKTREDNTKAPPLAAFPQ
jgi:TolA-binding protein